MFQYRNITAAVITSMTIAIMTCEEKSALDLTSPWLRCSLIEKITHLGMFVHVRQCLLTMLGLIDDNNLIQAIIKLLILALPAKTEWRWSLLKFRHEGGKVTGMISDSQQDLRNTMTGSYLSRTRKPPSLQNTCSRRYWCKDHESWGLAPFSEKHISTHALYTEHSLFRSAKSATKINSESWKLTDQNRTKHKQVGILNNSMCQ